MKKSHVIRLSILTLFFLSLFAFAFCPQECLFNSPDENANAFFALRFAQTGELSSPVPFEASWQALVHPRSMLVYEDMLVPISFLGLPIVAGAFVFLFGNVGMLLVTPLLSVLAVVVFWSLSRRLFKNERLADLCAFLLMFHPAFWHYSARVMMHNVGFVALLIVCVWIFFARKRAGTKIKERIWYMIGAGMLATALAFRLSEAVWVLPLFASLAVYKRKHIGIGGVVAIVIGFLCVLVPLGSMHHELYGSPFATGYTAQNPSVTSETAPASLPTDTQERHMLAPMFFTLFPFGIHEMNIVRNAWGYGMWLYPWMSLLSLVGFALVLIKRERAWKPWIIVSVCVSAWLIVVYGSWNIADNPDARVLSLGNSYARYWLPLFVLGALFGAKALDSGFTWMKVHAERLSRPALALVCSLIALCSAHLVVFGPDGVLQTRANLQVFSEKKEAIVSATEQDALIIADMADKYVFPDRFVVTPLRNQTVYEAIPDMIEHTSVYYFGITLPEQDLAYLHEVLIPGVQFIPLITMQDETLYAIEEKH